MVKTLKPINGLSLSSVHCHRNSITITSSPEFYHHSPEFHQYSPIQEIYLHSQNSITSDKNFIKTWNYHSPQFYHQSQNFITTHQKCITTHTILLPILEFHHHSPEFPVMRGNQPKVHLRFIWDIIPFFRPEKQSVLFKAC